MWWRASIHGGPGSVPVRAWNGSSGFGSGGSFLGKGFLPISVQFKGMARFRFRFLKTVPTVPVSVPGKTSPEGSGSVPVPSCRYDTVQRDSSL